ncbi:MAG: LacI family DNA-binding transcriptional regulator [Solobacterium sp.]|nr:LacI family DNA-binding transcriptional regulator [Solobacterium sp.]MBR2767937.1 LacI family DNA-binding transcriptional regulator [Solobacterium sp.]MBR2793428.1 LacI family DNA-binding transcriptional regulator [Solobacterium sp.]
MTTIKDIARLSGYSIGTVSRVINNHPDVSEAARIKVEQVIREQNFQPNSNAKQLKQQSNSAITIIVKGYENMFFEGILERVQAILRDSGEDVAVAFLDEYSNEVQTAIQLCAARKPKGFIFLGGNLEFFKQDGHKIDVPCVLLTNTAKDLELTNLSSYSTNDEEAGYTVIDYLIRQGHSKVGIIGGSASRIGSQIGFRRMKGCLDAFAEHGLFFDEKTQYQPSRFSMAGGYESTQKLLKKNPEITAIFAIGDTIAIGAMRAIKDMGLSIPEDISVIGYDGIESGRYTIPRLSTIHQDTELLARKGVEDLLLRINYSHPITHEDINYTMVEGESVAKPRKRKEIRGR